VDRQFPAHEVGVSTGPFWGGLKDTKIYNRHKNVKWLHEAVDDMQLQGRKYQNKNRQ
jgi:hypothetical protein